MWSNTAATVDEHERRRSTPGRQIEISQRETDDVDPTLTGAGIHTVMTQGTVDGLDTE